MIDRLAEFLCKLIREGRYRVRLNEVPYYRKWYLEKYLDFLLIREGKVRARYVGPPRRRMVGECKRVKSTRQDPWITGDQEVVP